MRRIAWVLVLVAACGKKGGVVSGGAASAEALVHALDDVAHGANDQGLEALVVTPGVAGMAISCPAGVMDKRIALAERNAHLWLATFRTRAAQKLEIYQVKSHDEAYVDAGDGLAEGCKADKALLEAGIMVVFAPPGTPAGADIYHLKLDDVQMVRIGDRFFLGGFVRTSGQ
jgi:hypothetical protein